jgi:hypothetical protein
VLTAVVIEVHSAIPSQTLGLCPLAPLRQKSSLAWSALLDSSILGLREKPFVLIRAIRVKSSAAKKVEITKRTQFPLQASVIQQETKKKFPIL